MLYINIVNDNNNNNTNNYNNNNNKNCCEYITIIQQELRRVLNNSITIAYL